jgi:hypothetical protein
MVGALITFCCDRGCDVGSALKLRVVGPLWRCVGAFGRSGGDAGLKSSLPGALGIRRWRSDGDAMVRSRPPQMHRTANREPRSAAQLRGIWFRGSRTGSSAAADAARGCARAPPLWRCLGDRHRRCTERARRPGQGGVASVASVASAANVPRARFGCEGLFATSEHRRTRRCPAHAGNVLTEIGAVGAPD